MRKRALNAALAALTVPAGLWAQFRDLATTNDGSRLFFISALRQPGTSQGLYPKIFALDETAVSLIYEPPVWPSDPYRQYSVGPLQAAGDGDWVLYGTQRACTGGSSCFLNEQRGAVLVRRGSEPEPLGANSRFSRDGRWLLTYSSPGVMLSYFWRIDRRTGKRDDLTAVARPAAAPSVALNGAVLIPAFDRLLLWDGSQARTLAGKATAAVIDDAATTVVYQESVETPGAAGIRLRVIDLASGRMWPLGPDDRDNFAPVLSADGNWALYLSRMGPVPQAFFSRRDGSGWRQLTDLPAGVAQATLSGDGRVAWAAAADGAVYRIETGSGTVERRLAATPSIIGPPEGSPGSAVIVKGANFDKVTGFRLGGRTVEWSKIDSGSVLIRLPWDFPLGATELAAAGGDDRFESAIPFSVREFSPALAAAVHEDFSALVSESKPVRPGEILHLYLMGLGPVDSTGRTTLPWEWRWGSQEGPLAEVFYSGVAPGFPGFYQVDIRAPRELASPLVVLFLYLSPQAGGWYSWVPGIWPAARTP